MDIPALETLRGKPLPGRLKDCISAVLGEKDEDAADEIVELGEEILHQLAAAGFARYLRSGQQTESVNDFLLQLFASSGHDYNAGPLYRWAANAVKDIGEMREQSWFPFFWMDNQLNADAQHFSELRNRVMHGFFVLPPEVNRAEAERMAAFMESMLSAGLFITASNLHFVTGDGFTGNWNITAPEQWVQLIADTPFGRLCNRVVEESGDTYWSDQAARIAAGDDSACPDAVKSFVQGNRKGALAIWVHPADPDPEPTFTAACSWLMKQEGLVTIAYSIAETGLSFTDSFLLQRLIAVLQADGAAAGKGKKLADVAAALRKKEKRKVVVLVSGIHRSMFSPKHLLTLRDFLHRNDILLIAAGHHFAHLDQSFNSSLTIPFPASVPDGAMRRIAMHNYLRFKGPFADRFSDAPAVAELERIMDELCFELAEKREVYARRFADAHDFSGELVNEVFAILQPWVSVRRAPFEPDTLDELYGVPSVVTEATPVYLALGRRDVRLEYQHKILSL